MNDEIVLRPIKWHWSDWTARFAKLDAARKAQAEHAAKDHQPVVARAAELIELTSGWMREADAWAATLPLDERRDVIDLLLAEVEMLWQVVDPAAHAPTGYFPGAPTDDDRLDFRQRFYVAQPLLVLAERYHFSGVEVARRAFTDLEVFTSEKRRWLP